MSRLELLAAMAGVALALSAFVSGVPASAGLVVASSGPSTSRFPTGTKLDDDAWITLAKGDSITILDGRGTRVLRGPGRFSVSKPGRVSGNPVYTALVRSRAGQRAVTAAVRTGRNGELLSPNLWYLDIRKSGTQCLADPANVRVWRPVMDKGMVISISRNGEASGRIGFDKGSTLAVWDTSAVPAGEGATYLMSDESGKSLRTVKFALLSNPPAEPEDLASALIERGCIAQLDLLSDTLAITR